MHSKGLTVIDLFCGAGGLSEGFRQAGFRVLAGNDINKAAGRTFKLTHPEACFLHGPIENFSNQEFLSVSGLNENELDCLVGGPPCQAYSVYNHKRGLQDERSKLFQEYLRVVKGLRPKWVVMENVTGITSCGEGQPVQDILNGLIRLNYKVEMKILKAEDYGVPQERRRVIFIGNRLGLPIFWPEKTHGKNLKPFVSVQDAISDLPPLRNGDDLRLQTYLTPPQNGYQRRVRNESVIIKNHAAPKLHSINLKRMKFIPQGGSWRDIPVNLLPEGMKRAKRSDHTKRYGRLHPKKQASTILTKCDLHWGAFIHPDQDRAISVREAARFQSFPDWFEFLGSRTEQYAQVGNAVPPIIAKRIAETIFQGMETTIPISETNYVISA